MKTEELNIESIIPFSGNAKAHPATQIKKIAASIKEYGFQVPILIDKNNVVITGHGRLLAAKQLGLKKVPVRCLDNLTEAQSKAFRLMDNKSSESKWITDKLTAELQALSLDGFDLQLVGFDDAALLKMIEADDCKTLESQILDEDEYHEARSLAEKILSQVAAHVEHIVETCPEKLNRALMVIVNKGDGNEVIFMTDPCTKDVVLELQRHEENGSKSPLEKLTESVWK